MTVSARPVTDLKSEILAVIERHVGRDNAITAGTIGERLGLGKLKNTYPIREAMGCTCAL